MSTITNKVLAVINDLEAVDAVLKKAISIAQENKAILEVLFVHEEKLFALPDFFRFKETPEKDLVDKDKVKKEIEGKLASLGYTHEPIVLVQIDDTVDRVLEFTKHDEAATVVMQNEETITKKLAQHTNLDVVTL